MTLFISNWIESEQITELISMATEQNNSGNSTLKYMKLDEFAKNKTGNKDYLRRYTKLNNIKTIKAKSYISQEDLAKLKELQLIKAKEEEERAKKRAQKEKEQKEWQF